MEKKNRSVKDLANQVVADAEEDWRTEEVQRPATSKAVVPQLIRGVLSLEWTAHQYASEVAQNWGKVPKASGSRSITNMVSNSELDAL